MSANTAHNSTSPLTVSSLSAHNHHQDAGVFSGGGLLRTPVTAAAAPAAVATGSGGGGSSHHSHHHTHHIHNAFREAAQGHTHHSPVTLSGAPVLPLLQSKPAAAADDAVGEIESKLSSQLGIKDAEKCAAVAKCLVQQGCSSWGEMLDLGGLFETGDEKADIEGLRKFLQEAGVPLFIAAKLAAYIKKS